MKESEIDEMWVAYWFLTAHWLQNVTVDPFILFVHVLQAFDMSFKAFDYMYELGELD